MASGLPVAVLSFPLTPSPERFPETVGPWPRSRPSFRPSQLIFQSCSFCRKGSPHNDGDRRGSQASGSPREGWSPIRGKTEEQCCIRRGAIPIQKRAVKAVCPEATRPKDGGGKGNQISLLLHRALSASPR